MITTLETMVSLFTLAGQGKDYNDDKDDEEVIALVGGEKEQDVIVDYDVPAVIYEEHVVYEYPGPEVIKLEYRLKLKIKSNDWLLADICPQAANHCVLF